MGDDSSLAALATGNNPDDRPCPLSKFDRLTKKLQLFDLPFLFKDMAAVERSRISPDGQPGSGGRAQGCWGLAYCIAA